MGIFSGSFGYDDPPFPFLRKKWVFLVDFINSPQQILSGSKFEMVSKDFQRVCFYVPLNL